MSDEQKPIQTPFDRTVPDLETDTDTFGDERAQGDLGGGRREPAPGVDRVQEEVAIEREEKNED